MRTDECVLYITKADRDDYENIYEKYGKLFEAGRIERIEKTSNLKVRKNLILTGTLLCRVLRDFGVSCDDIAYGLNDKPYIKGNDKLFFNISHSGDYIAVAVSGQEIGMDIQKPVPYREKIVQRIMSDSERERLSDVVASRFNYVWAIKESYSKYTGQGITTDFSKVTFEGDDERLEIFYDGARVAFGTVKTISGDYELCISAKDVFSIINSIKVSF